MTERFIVYGRPTGKERPVVTAHGTFTPKKTREYEAKVRDCWRTQSGYMFPDDTAITASIDAYFTVPASYSQRRKAELDGAAYTKRSDADNLAKAVLDALNGYAYKDDSAVAVLKVRKLYTTGTQRVEVILESEEIEQ